LIEQAKFESILRLLVKMSGSFGKTIAELAEDMERSERTIRRYIQTFRDCGFVVENRNGYFRISEFEKGKNLSDLLHFSSEESELLSRAIHSIDFDGALKESLTKKLYSLYDNNLVPYAIVSAEKSENITALCEAIRQKKQVILHDYSSSNSGRISDRVVEPYDFTTNYTMVCCYEPASNSVKFFKLARIGKVIITDTPWAFENLHAKIFVDVFRISGENLVRVKLRLSLRAYQLLIEEFPLSENYVTPGDYNSYIFEADVCSYEGVGRFVLGLPDEVSVISPDDFKEFLNEKILKKF